MWVVGITVLGLGQLESLIVLSPLVLHPLVIALAQTQIAAPRLHTFVRWMQLPCAALLAVALAHAPSLLAAVLALPWLVVTGLTAVLGLQRLRKRGIAPLHELAIDGGLAFVSVGGLWAVATCAGFTPLDFSPTIVALTAAHFHYAGFVLPVLSGIAVGHVNRSYTRWIPIAILGGVPLVAVGITASPLVEMVGAIVLAAGAVATAVTQLSVAANARRRLVALLLAGSALALLWGISLAVIYAVGEYRGLPWPSIPEMVHLHGSVNALGYGLVATWAWTLHAREERRG